MAILYKDYRPTSFDIKGIALKDRQDWIVVPCGRNRDSGILEESNFIVVLEMLGGDSEIVEVHCFGHWAVGWIEIIIVHPSLADRVQEIEDKLENYPILSDTDYSERECAEAYEIWERMSLRDKIDLCKRCRISIFAARSADIPSSIEYAEVIGE